MALGGIAHGGPPFVDSRPFHPAADAGRGRAAPITLADPWSMDDEEIPLAPGAVEVAPADPFGAALKA